MSDTEDMPEGTDDEPDPVLPQILFYAVSAELLSATITAETDPTGPNVGDRYKTQLISARTQKELTNRCVSVLIAEFGLSPDDAQSAVDNATPIVPMGDGSDLYVPLTGGQMTGPLLMVADPEDPVEAATKHYVDNVDNMKLNDFGGTLTGPLILAPLADPPDPMEAVGKQYVDDADGVVADNAAADTAEAISASQMGVTDGSDAQPGQIGEYIVVSNITGLAMDANMPLAVCTISLPPGCWEIWGACDFTVLSTGVEALAGAPIQPNQLGSSISLYPNAMPSQDDLIVGTGVMNLIYSPLQAGQRQVLITGQCRSNSTDPIDLYLVGQIGLGNVNVAGYVSARRVR